MRKLWLLVLIILFSSPVFPIHCQTPSTLPNLLASDWLVLGPFDTPTATGDFSSNNQFDRDHLLEIGGAAEARPKDGMVTAGEKWQTYRSANGVLDFGSIFPGRYNCAAYAYLEFSSPLQQRCILKMGSDDGLKVWCNGRLVWSHQVQRALAADDDAVPVELQSGVNRLLVKIDQLSGGWGLTLRFGSQEEADRAWENVKHPALLVHFFERVFANPQQARCLVCTVPMLGVQIPVELVVLNQDQKEICRASGRTGEPISLPLPGDYQGLFMVTASSQEPRLQSDSAIGIAGDGPTVIRQLIKVARETAARQAPTPDRCEDLGATLTFLCDQLEAKLHPSLSDTTCQTRALQSISDLCRRLRHNPWPTGKITGIRQWAYRSKVDGSLQPYTVYLPAGYNPAQKYSLLVTLHGWSENDYNAVSALAEVKPDDFIIIAPYGRGDMGYRSIGELDVLDVIVLAQNTYAIDPDRVFLTGSSMGGLGVWRIGTFYADRFAAIAPFCGWTSEKYLTNLRNTPVMIVHGDQDDTVPIVSEQSAAAALQKMGYSVTFEVLPGVAHDAWRGLVSQKGGPYLFDYFRRFRRNPWPDRLCLTTDYLRYGKQYWLRLAELTPGRTGTIKARVGQGQIVVETANVTAFSLDLRHPKLTNSKTATLVIDRTRLTVPTGNPRAFFVRQNHQWQPTTDDRPSATVRHFGGGLADLLMGPVVFIYGTASPERTAVLRQAAEKFAAWEPTSALPMGSKLGKFRIMADTEASLDDLKGKNLLLFGTPRENQILARLQEKLPVRFTGGDAFEFAGEQFKQAGISLTCPNPDSPGNLITLVALPFSQPEIEALLETANLSFRAYQIDSTAGDAVFQPDVIIFPAALSGYRSWSFNRYWSQPVEW